jgi:hypothetical protein
VLLLLFGMSIATVIVNISVVASCKTFLGVATFHCLKICIETWVLVLHDERSLHF